MKSAHSNILLGVAQTADLALIWEIWQKEAVAYLANWTRSDFAKCIEEGRVYFAESVSIGPVALLVVSPLIEGEVEILQVLVVNSQRRKGLAKRLIAYFIDKHQKLLESIFLEVHEDNLKAKDLYIGLGFVKVGHRANYYEDGGAAEVLKLHIKKAK